MNILALLNLVMYFTCVLFVLSTSNWHFGLSLYSYCELDLLLLFKPLFMDYSEVAGG